MHDTTDAEIRDALKKSLHRGVPTRSRRIVEEVGLGHGRARVDLMAVGASLHGYEIKSDRDTLARLPAQIPTFGAVLDKITLVVGWTHATTAMRSIPSWWGVLLAERVRGGGVRFVPLRDGAENPAPELRSIVNLLWKAELSDLLTELGVLHEGRRTKAELTDMLLAANASFAAIHEGVRCRVRRREDWRPGLPLESDDG